MTISKEEQLCGEGDQAEALLQTDAFNATVNSLVEQTFQSFCNSKLEDTEARERSFHHYRALVDIVHTLQQRVSIRDEIIAKTQTDDINQSEEE